jgi:folate-binding protein YgfZ
MATIVPQNIFTGSAAWLDLPGQPAADDGDFAFAPPLEEAAAALSGSVISPLPQLSAIRASGAEADSFLQNQLSNDLRQLGTAQAQLASYNSPKGRVLDLLLLRRAGANIVLETRRDTLAATLRRLRMFVLRTKVQLEDCGEHYGAFGLAGPEAAASLAQAGLPLPAQDWDWLEADGVTVLRRPGGRRYSVYADAPRLAALWEELATQLRPVGSAAWRLLEIRAGLPAIRPETTDHFVAQMLNLDRLGAISFSKGCYPGQEIVARMHYLGNLKRRMFLCETAAAEAAPGAAIHAAEGEAQLIGEVVQAAPLPQGGLALLAVLQLGHASDTHWRLGTIDAEPVSVRISALDAAQAA